MVVVVGVGGYCAHAPPLPGAVGGGRGGACAQWSARPDGTQHCMHHFAFSFALALCFVQSGGYIICPPHIAKEEQTLTEPQGHNPGAQPCPASPAAARAEQGKSSVKRARISRGGVVLVGTLFINKYRAWVRVIVPSCRLLCSIVRLLRIAEQSLKRRQKIPERPRKEGTKSFQTIFKCGTSSFVVKNVTIFFAQTLKSTYYPTRASFDTRPLARLAVSHLTTNRARTILSGLSEKKLTVF